MTSFFSTGFLLWLQQFRTALGPLSEDLISYLSDFILGLIIAVSVWLYWCKDKQTGRRMIAGFTLTIFANTLIKQLFRIPRPWLLDPALHPSEKALRTATGYSFPSAHTQISSLLYGTLFYYRFRHLKHPFLIPMIMTLLVGFSRNYLGVHTLLDVIGGGILGLVTLYFIRYLYPHLHTHKAKLYLTLAGIIAAAILIIYILLVNYPAAPDKYMEGLLLNGIILGALCGMYAEIRYVKFEVTATTKDGLIRFLTGAVITGLIFLVFSYLYKTLPFAGLFKFLQGACISLFVTFLYPMCFTKKV